MIRAGLAYERIVDQHIVTPAFNPFIQRLNRNSCSSLFSLLFYLLACLQDMSGAGNLAFWSRFRGGQEIETEVATLLEDVDLTEAGQQRAKEYSGGMRRRLSVAIACVGDPAVVFLDEPTTGMDPLARRKIWELIRRFKQGPGVVLNVSSTMITEQSHIPTPSLPLSLIRPPAGRVVCLTTHSMEEADALGDDIGILACLLSPYTDT